MFNISDRAFKLLSLLVVAILIGALAAFKMLQSEALIAAVVTLIYAVVDVFKSESGKGESGGKSS